MQFCSTSKKTLLVQVSSLKEMGPITLSFISTHHMFTFMLSHSYCRCSLGTSKPQTLQLCPLTFPEIQKTASLLNMILLKEQLSAPSLSHIQYHKFMLYLPVRLRRGGGGDQRGEHNFEGWRKHAVGFTAECQAVEKSFMFKLIEFFFIHLP